jgi:ELWxxDGT repeat protein
MPLTVFGAQQANNDVELWGTNGTTGGTFLIKDINTGGSGAVTNTAAGTGAPLPFAVIGNYAYFSATDGSTGTELWRTDGTAAGTTKVTEFSTNNGTGGDPSDDITGFNPSNIVAANGFIFFIGSGPAAVNPSTSPPRYGIWKYDPGTNLTTFISDDGPTQMISAGGRIYWTEDSGEGGIVRSSDGIAAVTTHFDGGFSSPPASLYDADGTV